MKQEIQEALPNWIKVESDAGGWGGGERAREQESKRERSLLMNIS